MMTQQQNNCLVTEEEIIKLADSMAAAAASFNAHGYDNFIQVRDDFKQKVHEVFLCSSPRI